MANTKSYEDGLKAGVAKARQILKESQERLLRVGDGMKFAHMLDQFSRQCAEGSSWNLVRSQIPSEEGTDKSRFYDVRIVLKLDMEKIKQAIVNPEGYEDEYEDDFQSVHDDEAKVAKFSKYDYVVLEVIMKKGADTMSTPKVYLSFESRDGSYKNIVVEQMNYVNEDAFNDVVVGLVEEFIIGDSRGSFAFPEEVAERYGLLLNRV